MGSLSLVYMDILRECLLLECGCSSPFVVNDFVLLTFFVGNDFIPPLRGISEDRDALRLLDTLWELYVREFGTKQHFLVRDGNFDLEQLTRFIEIAVDEAQNRLVRQRLDSLRVRVRHSCEDSDDESLRIVGHQLLDNFTWVYSYYRAQCLNPDWISPLTDPPHLVILVPFFSQDIRLLSALHPTSN